MTDWVEITWPGTYKAKVTQYLQMAGLECRSADDGRHRITTSAEYHGRPGRLLRVLTAGSLPTIDPSVVGDALARWGASPADDAEMMDDNVRQEVERLLGRETPAWNNYLEATQLLATCLSRAEFNRFVQENLVPTCRETLEASTISIIDFDHQIHTRTAVVRALFVATHAPEWADPSSGRGFESMRGLSGGALQGQSTWIDPLFAALFPWMFGVGVARAGSGLIAIGFGQALGYRSNLLDGELDSLIRADLLQGDVSIRAPATPAVTPEATLGAIEWWTDSMSQLLSVVLDPVNHADGDGQYVPRHHFALLVTFERLMASVIKSLLGSGRDEYSRRVHLFEVLDLLEGLGFGGYDKLLRASTLRADLELLSKRLPTDVAELLLPRCEDAVAGVERVADGFVPSRCSDGMLNVDTGPVKLENAASFVLRQIRNAGHGLKKALEDPKKREFVALHDGAIPNSVSDVAFFHLLLLLSFPERLTRRLSSGRRGRDDQNA